MSGLWMGRTIVLKKDTQIAGTMPESLKEILYYGALAPSSHNTQMWKVNYLSQSKKLHISLDRSRVLTQVDHQGREAWISLGAFLENLKQAFAAYGCEIILELGERPEQEGIWIHIPDSLPDKPENPELLTRMKKRHTEKGVFEDQPLSPVQVELLLQAYPKLCYEKKGTVRYTYLLNGTIQAMAVQSAVQAKRNELAQWLRFSDQETEEKRDGLPAEQLGMSGIKKVFYYGFMNREGAKKDSYAKQGNQLTQKQAQSSAGFFLLFGENTVKGWIQTGMKLEAFWLDCAEYGISIHPMSQMLEEEPFRSELNTQFQTEQPVQMILRAGIQKNYGENKEIRRKLNDFVSITEK